MIMVCTTYHYQGRGNFITFRDLYTCSAGYRKIIDRPFKETLLISIHICFQAPAARSTSQPPATFSVTTKAEHH